MRTVFRKLGWLKNRRQKENELREELAFHLEEEGGADAARRELGNVTLVMEDTRAAWSWVWLEQFFQDVRYAGRTMLNNKTFTLLAALSLALGIGANTAIYSFLDALLLRSLPVPDPQSLVVLNWHLDGKQGTDGTVVHNGSGSFHEDAHYGTTTGIFPYPAFELLRDSNPAFTCLFAYRRSEKLNLMMRGQAEESRGDYVSGSYFSGLELIPAAGRLIFDEDDRPGAPGVVVLSFAYAQKRFGDPASAAGQPVLINNVPFTAVGVTPPGFSGVDPSKTPDFYLPLHADLLLGPDRIPGDNPPKYADDHYYWIEMMGRLRPGVTLAHAETVLGQRFDTWVASTVSKEEERKHLPRLLAKEAAAASTTCAAMPCSLCTFCWESWV